MFQEIKPEEWKENVFQEIGKNWMLVTAEQEGKVNLMTASWGGAGILWGKPVAFVFLRPQRYTKQLVDAGERFSLSFFPEQYHPALVYAGKVSGREEDKVAGSGLTVVHDGSGTPYFQEARTAFICKKLYASPLLPEDFLTEGTKERWYPEKDYHTMYVAEIEKIWTKK